MKLGRMVTVAALSIGLSGACFAQSNVDTTHQTKQELKQQQKTDKAQAKADKAQRKALGTKQQKQADKAQDKADHDATKTPQ